MQTLGKNEGAGEEDGMRKSIVSSGPKTMERDFGGSIILNYEYKARKLLEDYETKAIHKQMEIELELISNLRSLVSSELTMVHGINSYLPDLDRLVYEQSLTYFSDQTGQLDQAYLGLFNFFQVRDVLHITYYQTLMRKVTKLMNAIHGVESRAEKVSEISESKVNEYEGMKDEV